MVTLRGEDSPPLTVNTSDTKRELPLSLQLTLLVRKARFLHLAYTSSSFGYGVC